MKWGSSDKPLTVVSAMFRESICMCINLTEPYACIHTTSTMLVRDYPAPPISKARRAGCCRHCTSLPYRSTLADAQLNPSCWQAMYARLPELLFEGSKAGWQPTRKRTARAEASVTSIGICRLRVESPRSWWQPRRAARGRLFQHGTLACYFEYFALSFRVWCKERGRWKIVSPRQVKKLLGVPCSTNFCPCTDFCSKKVGGVLQARSPRHGMKCSSKAQTTSYLYADVVSRFSRPIVALL